MSDGTSPHLRNGSGCRQTAGTGLAVESSYAPSPLWKADDIRWESAIWLPIAMYGVCRSTGFSLGKEGAYGKHSNTTEPVERERVRIAGDHDFRPSRNSAFQNRIVRREIVQEITHSVRIPPAREVSQSPTRRRSAQALSTPYFRSNLDDTDCLNSPLHEIRQR